MPTRVQSIGSRSYVISQHAHWPIRAPLPTCANQDAWVVITPKRPKANSIHTATRHAWARAPTRNTIQRAVFSLIHFPASFIRLWSSRHGWGLFLEQTEFLGSDASCVFQVKSETLQESSRCSYCALISPSRSLPRCGDLRYTLHLTSKKLIWQEQDLIQLGELYLLRCKFTRVKIGAKTSSGGLTDNCLTADIGHAVEIYWGLFRTLTCVPCHSHG